MLLIYYSINLGLAAITAAAAAGYCGSGGSSKVVCLAVWSFFVAWCRQIILAPTAPRLLLLLFQTGLLQAHWTAMRWVRWAATSKCFTAHKHNDCSKPSKNTWARMSLLKSRLSGSQKSIRSSSGAWTLPSKKTVDESLLAATSLGTRHPSKSCWRLEMEAKGDGTR